MNESSLRYRSVGTTLRVDGARPQVRMGWPVGEPDPAAMQRDAVKAFNGFHLATVPRR